MQRYFDAHVYVANWRTAIFMVRLPKEALTKETAKAVSVPYPLEAAQKQFQKELKRFMAGHLRRQALIQRR